MTNDEIDCIVVEGFLNGLDGKILGKKDTDKTFRCKYKEGSDKYNVFMSGYNDGKRIFDSKHKSSEQAAQAENLEA